uniref:Ig-like domain-containing protein n=1 Tax=Varanus komodoensis TaxID=61221 RepID=A0A8D2L2X3_VARKO
MIISKDFLEALFFHSSVSFFLPSRITYGPIPCLVGWSTHGIQCMGICFDQAFACRGRQDVLQWSKAQGAKVPFGCQEALPDSPIGAHVQRQAGRAHGGHVVSRASCEAPSDSLSCCSSVQQLTISVIKPSPKNLFEGKANLTCTVVGLNLDNVHITWYVDDKRSTEGQKDAVKVDASGSQNVRGFHPVSLEQWRRGTKFTCKAAGPCYEEVSKEVTIKTDSPSENVPIAKLMQPTSQDVALLACEISGFFPHNSEYITWPPVAASGSPTFTTQSILKVPASEWKTRALYTYVVGHESLTDMKGISRELDGKLEHRKLLCWPKIGQVLNLHSTNIMRFTAAGLYMF